MGSELDPAAVMRSLAVLRSSYVPETVSAAAERLARERPPSTESFSHQVSRCLAELRALDELVRYLRLAKFP